MGELCILLLVIGFLCNFFYDSKDAWRRGDYWKEAQEKGERYFHDGSGSYRTSDGKKVFLSRDMATGELFETDLKTGKRTNVSQADRETALYHARVNGYPSAVKWSNVPPQHKNPYVDFMDLYGDCWKDVKTGRLLIVTRIGNGIDGGILAFRDLRTKKIIRLTDEYYERERYAKEHGYDYISDEVLNSLVTPLTDEELKNEKGGGGRYDWKFFCSWEWPDMTDAEKESWIRNEMKGRTKSGLHLIRWEPKGYSQQFGLPTVKYNWGKDGKIYRRPEKWDSFTMSWILREKKVNVGDYKYPEKIVTINGVDWQFFKDLEGYEWL